MKAYEQTETQVDIAKKIILKTSVREGQNTYAVRLNAVMKGMKVGIIVANQLCQKAFAQLEVDNSLRGGYNTPSLNGERKMTLTYEQHYIKQQAISDLAEDKLNMALANGEEFNEALAYRVWDEAEQEL